MNNSTFKNLIQHIEVELAASYGFVIDVSAGDCLTTSDLARSVAADNRAALILRSSGDDLELGLYFRPELIEKMEDANPLERLDSQNLDAFCVAVEEVSHFHLVVKRAQSKQGVSRLELEWQGEVDKWMVASSLLEQQTGDTHLPQLARLLFDSSVCYTHDQNLYDAAHRLAARYCYKLLPQIQDCPARKRAQELKSACRQTYDMQWGQKLRAIANL